MTALGLSDAQMTAVRGRGWSTMQGFSFSSGYNPSHADDTPFVNSVIIPILNDANHPDAWKLRQLFFESYTLAVAELKRKVERTDDDPPRRLAVPEREARAARIALRLPGLKINEELEPSHRIVDTYVQMHEDNCIRWVEWHEYTRRSQEVLNVKRDAASMSVIVTDVGSDWLIHKALQRRSLALDMAGLCSFEVSERITEKFMSEMHRPPLHGFDSVGFEQIKRADQHIWTRLAQLTSSGVQRNAQGILPLEAAILIVMSEAETAYLLVQIQNSKRKAEDAPSTKEIKGKGKKEKAAKAKAKATGKGKGAGKDKPSARLPKDLIGCASITKSGDAFCFGFNLASGCKTKQGAGSKCPNGWHLCCHISGCEGLHAFCNHK